MEKFVIIQVEGTTAIIFEGLMFDSYDEAKKFLETKAIGIIEDLTGVKYKKVEDDEFDLRIDKRNPHGHNDSSICFSIHEIHKYKKSYLRLTAPLS